MAKSNNISRMFEVTLCRHVLGKPDKRVPEYVTVEELAAIKVSAARLGFREVLTVLVDDVGIIPDFPRVDERTL